MDRGAWTANVHGVGRVGHDRVTEHTHTHKMVSVTEAQRQGDYCTVWPQGAERLDSKARKPKRNSGCSDPELGLHPFTNKKKNNKKLLLDPGYLAPLLTVGRETLPNY